MRVSEGKVHSLQSLKNFSKFPLIKNILIYVSNVGIEADRLGCPHSEGENMVFRLRILLCGFFILALVFNGSGAIWAQDKAEDYFCQGQAAYDPNNLAKSREDAIHDLLVQGITQAIGAFMNPSQIGSQYEKLQKNIFSQPQHYVQKFQIFSENSSGGIYRLTGQVTVTADTLKKDLQQLDLLASKTSEPQIAAEPEVASEAETVSEKGTTSEPEATSQSEVSSDSEAPPDAEAPSASESAAGDSKPEIPPDSSVKAQEKTGEASPEKTPEGASRVQQKIFWVVPEKWESDWHLPQKNEEPQSLFAANMLQESEDYPWTLVFPEEGSLGVNVSGNVSSSATMALAQKSGFQTVVIGIATLERGQDQTRSLEVHLRVLDSASGQSRGEIHHEQSLQEGTIYIEKIADLAAVTASQLNQVLSDSQRWAELLRSSGEGVSQAEPSSPVSTQSSPSSTEPQQSSLSADNQTASKTSPSDTEVSADTVGEENSGDWVLVLQSADHYRLWEELEKVLREKFSEMKVKSMEFGTDTLKVRLNGVNSGITDALQGLQLRNGLKSQVNRSSSESRQLEMTFTPSEAPAQGPASP